MWRQRSGSTLTQVMACCLMAPSHHLIQCWILHDDVIQWKHFPRYWPFVWGIHRSPVNSPHKGHWRKALMFSLICAWINSWVNNHEAGDLSRHRAHYDVTVMSLSRFCGIHLGATSLCLQKKKKKTTTSLCLPRLLFCIMSLKVILSKLLPHLPGLMS